MEKILEGVYDLKLVLQNYENKVEQLTVTNRFLEEEAQQLQRTVNELGTTKAELEEQLAKTQEEISQYKSEIKTLHQIKKKHYPAPKSKKLFDWF
jgi:peptidoglycan hydrolase CwlO-like protein